MKRFDKIIYAILAVPALLLAPQGLLAAPLAISDSPVFLGGRADPNIMFTIDDSGSMNWEVMPDALRNSVNVSEPYPRPSRWGRRNVYDDYFNPASASVAQVHSSGVNGVYYDPAVRYYPWSNPDATFKPDATVTCAQYDPMNPNNGTCVNFDIPHTVCQGNCTNVQVRPAHYFVWDGVGAQNNIGSYTHVIIDPANAPFTGGPNRTDCANLTTCTYAEEIQNFANWFQYYRTRMMSAKAGVGRAFALQGTTMRVGFASINTGSRTIDGVGSNGAVIKGVRPFLTTDRTAWFNLLYNTTTNGSTPLRRASNYVGQYFMRSDNQGPWGKSPGTNDTTAHSVCRQNFHILMSDGYYNGSSPNVGDVDGSNGPTHVHADGVTTYQYQPSNPYKDNNSNMLADVAMKYWVNDLRPDLINAVPTTAGKDPAFWQHMVTFTVGLGVQGTLDPATDLPALTAGTKSWPSNNQIDDMWHAAVDGHGTFFSAKNATEFATALADQLRDIGGRTAGAAAAAVSSSFLQSDTDVYEAKMYTGDWSGGLISYPISTGPIGGPCPPMPYGEICINNPNWDASDVLTQSLTNSSVYYDTGRKIVTYNPSSQTGVPFRWNNLVASQQTVLRTNPDVGTLEAVSIGQRRLNYLRGKDDALFRNRSNYLGDIAYSSPLHVGPPKSKYPDDWNGSVNEPEDSFPYSDFQTAKAGRDRMVYVGANDGMLHAFDAYTGVERYAYIPDAVYGKVDVANAKFGQLNQLTSIGYSSKHHYFVDGSPKAEDVFYGSAWHTVLVGTLRAGGRGVYALDVTSATAATEGEAAAKVLWEFTDADDADLGLTFGEPYIARMQNGRWAVVIGNGYNNSSADGNKSATGHAVLFILFLDANLSDGTWNLGTDYLKLDTKVGSVGTPNGLASPTVVDIDFDYLADYIYAGDLQGNMWKFDVTDTNSANWKTGYGTAATPVPLFTATDSGGVPQPITSAPESGPHPLGDAKGLMIYFGTGKLIEPQDNLNVGQTTQSFYGIWDKNGSAGGWAAFNRNHLLAQQITSEVTGANSVSYRFSTDNPISWHETAGAGTYLGWYMDLVNTEAGNTDNKGERVIYDSILRNGKIIFVTMEPSADPCDYGGTGWLMELNAENGGSLSYAPFDVNGDGTIDANDTINGQFPSGRDFPGIPSKPAIVKGADGVEHKYVTDSTGTTVTFTENPGPRESGRKSWRQLQ